MLAPTLTARPSIRYGSRSAASTRSPIPSASATQARSAAVPEPAPETPAIMPASETAATASEPAPETPAAASEPEPGTPAIRPASETAATASEPEPAGDPGAGGEAATDEGP